MTISADFPYQSHYVDICGSKIHYVKEGVGDPILLLHGMPASSYVWRNIIPHLSTLGCCIAPDLIGMGKSDRPNELEYSVFDHIRYIEKFIETLQLKNITLVMHGWGSLIGFDYAMRNPKNCKGLVFYEAYLQRFNQQEVSLPLREQLFEFDQDKMNNDSAIDGIYYMDKFFPQQMMKKLDDRVMKYYREPFMTKGSEKVLRQYLKELPRNNDKNKINQLIENYTHQLTQSQLPKLMLYSVPGYLTTITTAMWAKEHLPRLEIVDVGEEFHYAQESNPMIMGEAISIWLQGVEQITKTGNQQ